MAAVRAAKKELRKAMKVKLAGVEKDITAAQCMQIFYILTCIYADMSQLLTVI